MNPALAEQWSQRFVEYEDALAAFYSLQDATHLTLEQSYVLTGQLRRLASLRKSVLDRKREFRVQRRTSGESARSSVSVRPLTSMAFPSPVVELVANRVAHGDTVLELGFRVDPKAIPQFLKLTGPIRIKFPFGESTFVAAYRLVRFRLVRDQFAFRFATVDPA